MRHWAGYRQWGRARHHLTAAAALWATGVRPTFTTPPTPLMRALAYAIANGR